MGILRDLEVLDRVVSADPLQESWWRTVRGWRLASVCLGSGCLVPGASVVRTSDETAQVAWLDRPGFEACMAESYAVPHRRPGLRRHSSHKNPRRQVSDRMTLGSWLVVWVRHWRIRVTRFSPLCGGPCELGALDA